MRLSAARDPPPRSAVVRDLRRGVNGSGSEMAACSTAAFQTRFDVHGTLAPGACELEDFRGLVLCGFLRRLHSGAGEGGLNLLVPPAEARKLACVLPVGTSPGLHVPMLPTAH